ncbi:hypothetical protein BDK51DRAFT_38268 [Blyttiomyces helicus]|uniref:Uncharacterized protein n=1 Tax=Blyttiomyces helicus TaxID=388810 RepID=A0A4P9W9M4_9FUNG|nr:hypothetical protein BDK51DRAFT_38268 [Blyttiomyces helicus]|eukprot:RKO86916.1 hypothetical protein BDK51DRAFT_38268 [Blyttiomyces helicus]
MRVVGADAKDPSNPPPSLHKTKFSPTAKTTTNLRANPLHLSPVLKIWPNPSSLAQQATAPASSHQGAERPRKITTSPLNARFLQMNADCDAEADFTGDIQTTPDKSTIRTKRPASAPTLSPRPCSAPLPKRTTPTSSAPRLRAFNGWLQIRSQSSSRTGKMTYHPAPVETGENMPAPCQSDDSAPVEALRADLRALTLQGNHPEAHDADLVRAQATCAQSLATPPVSDLFPQAQPCEPKPRLLRVLCDPPGLECLPNFRHILFLHRAGAREDRDIKFKDRWGCGWRRVCSYGARDVSALDFGGAHLVRDVREARVWELLLVAAFGVGAGARDQASLLSAVWLVEGSAGPVHRLIREDGGAASALPHGGERVPAC